MKILFVSLGCDKNLVDTEEMLGLLRDRNFTFTDDEREAEVIVVNTCCFIHDAKEESIETILSMAQLKEQGVCRALIVTGCLAQRYGEEIRREIPEVDGVLGTASWDKIGEVVEAALSGEKPQIFEETSRLPKTSSQRIVTTGGYYEYLKIAEGCDKHCTYCIIPKIRGDYRSVPMERLIAQAEELAAGGVKELILVAQETTLYGVDLYGKKSLPLLLEKLNDVEGLEWIRLLYCYPEEIDDDLIQAVKRLPKVCHYLDMPVQHASDVILKKMGRRTTRRELEAVIEKVRREIPDVILRTTLITGFPGENQADHEELMDFVDRMEFDRLGVFTYSAEEDTPAAQMPDQISEEIKEARRNELMCLQQEVILDQSQQRLNRTYRVLVEGKITGEDAYVGRTYMDAPDVDGYIFIHTEEELMSGDIVPVKVTGMLEYDLIGEIDYEFAQ